MAKNWIQNAVNPKHKGYCTPMTKETCTPHRKALAKRFKSDEFQKHEKGGVINKVNWLNKFQKGGFITSLPKTKPYVETSSTGINSASGYNFRETKFASFPNNNLPFLNKIFQNTPQITREINTYSTQKPDTTISGVGLNNKSFQFNSKGNSPQFRSVNDLFNRTVEAKQEGGEINKNIKQVEVVAKRPTTNYFYKSPADSIEYIGANGPVKTNTVDFVNTYRQAYDNSINTGASKFQALDKLYHDKNVIRLGIDSKKYPSQVFDMNMNSVDKTKLNPRRKLNYLPIIP